jgi:hypothetical protein
MTAALALHDDGSQTATTPRPEQIPKLSLATRKSCRERFYRRLVDTCPSGIVGVGRNSQRRGAAAAADAVVRDPAALCV